MPASFGVVPPATELDLMGLELTADNIAALLAVNEAEWRAEVGKLMPRLQQLKVPPAQLQELQGTLARFKAPPL